MLSGQKVWISTAQVAHKMLILARTTSVEQCTKPTLGLSLFYTDLDRSKVSVREIEGNAGWYAFELRARIGWGPGGASTTLVVDDNKLNKE